MSERTAPTLASFTTKIVAAFVSKNHILVGDLAGIIRDVSQAISALDWSAASVPGKQAPAVSIKKSLSPDSLICLFDGKQFKALKRHLRSEHGMTPADYRAQWGLPKAYPMVAPDYSATRSKMAKNIGLGRVASKPARRKARA